MSKQFTHGWALLIGVDQNQTAKWALPDVAKDVAALQKVLVHPARCAYPPEHVQVLTGADATRQGILDGLDWLSERLQGDAEATAVIYYTGHGWRDASTHPSDFYLIPYDVKASGVQARALRAADFAAGIAGMQPRRLLVILDCCHAAGMNVKDVSLLPPGCVGAAAAPPLFMPGGAGAKGLETLAVGRGRAVLSSSTGEQSSYIRQDRQMSIFTYHLIKALTGHAQPAEGAREVLVSDVMSYVTRRVPESARADHGADAAQTPDYQISGNFAVALLLGGAGLSKGQPAPDPLAPLPETTPAGVSYRAEVHGSGAIAQGPGATAAGAGGVAIGGSVGGDVVVGNQTTTFDQRGQTVGAQTNVAGGVHGPLLSGRFDGPVTVGSGEAVDLRGSQGAIYKPSGPVEQQFGDRIQITGLTVDEFLRLLGELKAHLDAARLAPDLAEEAAEDLRAVTAQARKPQPNGVIIRARLNSLLEMLATADGVWGITERVLPLARRALEAAGQLFR